MDTLFRVSAFITDADPDFNIDYSSKNDQAKNLEWNHRRPATKQSKLIFLVSKTGVLENPSTKLLNTAVHPEKHLLATRWPAQALFNDNECQRLGLDRTTYTLDQPAYRGTQGRQQYNMPHLEQRRKVKPSHPLQRRREHRCTKELLQLPMRCSIYPTGMQVGTEAPLSTLREPVWIKASPSACTS